MSPRTTIVLLLALLGSRRRSDLVARPAATGARPRAGGRRLLPGLVTADVTEIVIRVRADRHPAFGNADARSRKDGPTAGLVQRRRLRAPRVPGRTRAGLLEALREASFGAGARRRRPEDALGRHGLEPGQRVARRSRDAKAARRDASSSAPSSAQGGVAARVDGGWPPVEVDRQLLEDVTGIRQSGGSRRGSRRSTRRPPRACGSRFRRCRKRASSPPRESGQWAIREPALLRADQALVMRLLASLSALEAPRSISIADRGRLRTSSCATRSQVAGRPKPGRRRDRRRARRRTRSRPIAEAIRNGWRSRSPDSS